MKSDINSNYLLPLALFSSPAPVAFTCHVFDFVLSFSWHFAADTMATLSSSPYPLCRDHLVPNPPLTLSYLSTLT